jgi:hypothetical protein
MASQQICTLRSKYHDIREKITDISKKNRRRDFHDIHEKIMDISKKNRRRDFLYGLWCARWSADVFFVFSKK